MLLVAGGVFAVEIRARRVDCAVDVHFKGPIVLAQYDVVPVRGHKSCAVCVRVSVCVPI